MKLLRQIQALFERVVRSIEEHPTPLYRYFHLFGAILAVRLCLEFFSSHRLFRREDVEHIGLWFVFIVMAFMLQLQLFSGEKMAKVVKLVVVCFTIALTAPIIDLIVSGGVGAKMNYLAINNWQDFLWNYVTMGGSSLSRGATLGIRIEIFLLVMASFNYVRTKTGNIFRALLGAVSIYTVLVISGSVPKLLGLLVASLNLQYQTDDSSTLLLLLSADLFLLMVAIWRHAPDRFVHLLRKMPWKHFPLGGMLAILGVMVALQNYPDNFNWNPSTIFYPGLFLGVGLLLYAYWTIQLHAEWSYVQKHRSQAAILLLLFVVAGSIGLAALFISMVILGLQFLTYAAPLHLMKMPLLRNLLEAMQITGFMLLGFVGFGAPMVGFPSKALILVLLASTLLGLALETQNPRPSIIPWLGDMPARYMAFVRIGLALLWLLLVLWLSPHSDLTIWAIACLPTAFLIALGYQKLAILATTIPIIVWMTSQTL